jgi:GrpB-like predicted nucleotidyltransferase (UPF0157 family)
MTLPRFAIELREHDPGWRLVAEREAERLRGVLGAALVEVHHVGSTAIPGIRAKPIVDLVPVVHELAAFDARRAQIEALGYSWRGELGIPGRRYCVLCHPGTDVRIAQLHAFARGAEEIARHLAFRDYLRAHPDEARAYEAAKLAARARHAADVVRYNEAKAAWIQACNQRAAAWVLRRGPG